MSNFLKQVNGVITEEAPVTAGGAGNASKIPVLNGSGLLDITMMPAGIGADTITAVASEAIAAGALVNMWDNAGVLNMRNASGAAGSFKPAHGFALAAFASGASVTMYRSGQNTQLSGLTPGTDYFLSTSTPGAVQATAPASGSGYVSQKLGTAISAAALDIQLSPPTQLI